MGCDKAADMRTWCGCAGRRDGGRGGGEVVESGYHQPRIEKTKTNPRARHTRERCNEGAQALHVRPPRTTRQQCMLATAGQRWGARGGRPTGRPGHNPTLPCPNNHERGTATRPPAGTPTLSLTLRTPLFFTWASTACTYFCTDLLLFLFYTGETAGVPGDVHTQQPQLVRGGWGLGNPLPPLLDVFFFCRKAVATTGRNTRRAPEPLSPSAWDVPSGRRSCPR
jgi:hypothetical protein